MLIHIGFIIVMKQGTKFLFVSDPTKVPFSLGRGKSCHLSSQDLLRSRGILDQLPIFLYCHPICIELMMFFMYLFYDIMFLMNLTNQIGKNCRSRTWEPQWLNHYAYWTIGFDSLDVTRWTKLRSSGTSIPKICYLGGCRDYAS